MHFKWFKIAKWMDTFNMFADKKQHSEENGILTWLGVQ